MGRGLRGAAMEVESRRYVRFEWKPRRVVHAHIVCAYGSHPLAHRMTSNVSPPVLVSAGEAGELVLALNRPERRNALDIATVQLLRSTLREADCVAIVLCSATPGMFCAGADLSIPDDERSEVSRELYALYGEMLTAAVPVIAAIDGPAVGGGAQLAVAADLRVASSRSWIRFVGPGHGLAVGAWALPSLVGRGMALELCLSARRVDGTTAREIGLVDRLADDPLASASELAHDWSGLDRDAVRRVKEIVGLSTQLAAALEAERRGNNSWQGATG